MMREKAGNRVRQRWEKRLRQLARVQPRGSALRRPLPVLSGGCQQSLFISHSLNDSHHLLGT